VFDKGADEIAIIGNAVNLPDDIVANAQTVENRVESGIAGGDASR
jgi:hypothetical protein